MLSPGQKLGVFESQAGGAFAGIYAQHGGGEVPPVLQACELLSPGEKVVADRAGELVFAGTVRGRPNGFLAPLVRVKQLPEGVESAEVQIPLHFFYYYKDGYGHRIIGGSGMRRWAKLADLVLTPTTVDDSAIRDLTLSLGEEQIERRQEQVVDLVTRDAMAQLVSFRQDIHRAFDGIYISTS